MSISPQQLAATYSIVAYDPDANQLGVAVQSHYFGTGNVVPWLEPGVGAIATQSMVNVSYGPLGLALLRAGLSAPDTLRALLAGDADAERRQVAVMDADGNVATHTGECCIAAAEHRRGSYYSVQANLMEKGTVWEAMAETFEQGVGDLAERMMRALEAAQAEGGDIRGKQSAALVVVANKLSGAPWENRILDLHVDDSPDPLPELRRLLKVARAYRQWDRAYATLENTALEDERFRLAQEQFDQAPDLMPDNPEGLFWYAVNLVNAGRVDDALPLLQRVYEAQPVWRQLPGRLARAGLLPEEPDLIERITAS